MSDCLSIYLSVSLRVSLSVCLFACKRLNDESLISNSSRLRLMVTLIDVVLFVIALLIILPHFLSFALSVIIYSVYIYI